MNEDNILKIESDYKIIKPIFKKRYSKKFFRYQTKYSSKIFKPKQIFKNNFSLNEEDKNDFNDLIGQMNKSMELDLEYDEKDEDYLINSQKRNEKYLIVEILNILNQPILDEYDKNRNILQKDINNIYEMYEKNYNELKLEKKYNFENDNELYDSNCINNNNKSLSSNNSLENEQH